jgi:hypothetical protein
VSFVPILQVYNTLNSSLRNVVKIEKYICDDGKNQQNRRCDHDEEGVEVCLPRSLRGRDSHWGENEILTCILAFLYRDGIFVSLPSS